MKNPLIFIAVLALLIALFFAISTDDTAVNNSSISESEATQPTSTEVPEIIRENYDRSLYSATFAGGCFWCTEAAFQEVEGVENAISGYAGGEEYNPSYQAVIDNQTNHREAVKIFYDPNAVTYEQLLDVFWESIDPTDAGGQFVDRGFSYTTAIFYESEPQRVAAEKSKMDIESSDTYDGVIVSPILPFTTFYEAESYHQDFYLNSAVRYKNYEQNSGREEFKQQIARQLEELD